MADIQIGSKWPSKPLGELCEVIAGQSPPSSAYNDVGEGLPFYQGKADFGRDVPVVRKWCTRPTKLAREGDILVSVRAPVGPSNFATEECVIGRGLAALRAGKDLDGRWLRYWITHTQDQLRAHATGTTFEAISTGVLRKHQCPAPTIETQRRIVARIDELFAELDDGELALTRARSELETYRKALLKAAVTGELTADWRAANPTKETGADLLQRILTERRERWAQRDGASKKTAKRNTTPLDQKGELAFDFPDHWACAAIGQLGEIITGSTPATDRPDYYGGDVPFFTPGDLDCESARTTKRTLTEAGANSVRRVPAGSVLVTCIGATIGKLAVAGKSGATNQQINSVVPAKPILTDWIQAFLSSPCGQREIIDGSSSTTMPILNKGDFSRLPIPVPPLAEIREICAILSNRLDERHELNDAVNDLQTEPAGLRQSILAAAFRGDLVQ